MDNLEQIRDALKSRYRIERELGRGGSAVVYLARDLKHDREVALKVLRSDLAAALGSERFLHEIQVTAKLQHPHILPLHDSGVAGGVLYYVMPYVEGESLRDRLSREKQLPVRDAVRIVREVADALAYAHEKNVVHRDIKPENILLSGGHAMVSDFGIAQAILAAGDTRKTTVVQGTTSGTPTYMSPEQATGEVADARTDIYSLGCVLYELLVGKPPFAAATGQGLVKQILSAAPPVLREQRDTVPEPLEQAVLQALAKLPADRFSTVQEFAAALGPDPDTAHTQAAFAATGAAPARRPGAVGLVPALVVFLASSLAVVGVTYGLVRWIGLPDWVLYGVGLLLLAGLPVIVATGVVQGGAGGGAAAGPARWLTWRNAVLGGVVTLGLWVLTTGGYLVSRAVGIGPGASLVSAGLLDEEDAILIADFENQTNDPHLGETLKEALSIDMVQSSTVRVVPGSRVIEVLSRMEKPADTPVDPSLAREIAVRDGIKAVLAGQILSSGNSYVLTARLVAPESGDVLSAHRETAKDESGLIDAVDRLSRGIREKIGESLKTIRSERNLAAVTTGSLEALQKYSQAARLEDYQGQSSQASYYTFFEENDKTIAAYQQMLELDPRDTYALNNLSVLYNKTKDYAKALDYARRANTIEHAYNHDSNILAAYVGLNRPDQAESTWAALKESFSGSPSTAFMGAFAATAFQRYDAAEERMSGNLAMARTNPLVGGHLYGFMAGLAALQGQLGKLAEFGRASDEANEQTGRVSEIVASAAFSAVVDAFTRQRPDEGLVKLNEVLERYPLADMSPVDRPYVSLIEAYAAVGKPERSRELMAERERELDPRMLKASDAHAMLGDIALAEGRAEDAVAQFQIYDRTDNEVPGSSPLLAMAYDAAGQPDSAIAAYERYVNTPMWTRVFWDFTFLPGSYHRLAELHEVRGHMAQAAEYYRRFAELWKDADPELQPRVQAARRKAEMLAGGID
jgi:tetratricopeptide (TPR) repeat protein